MSALKKKPAQIILTLCIAAGIVLAGTFAWSSFTQNRINLFSELVLPDVNLHDDFAGGPNKDVYVENSGTAPALVRVRLTEFLQTNARGSMVEGHLRDDEEARWWAPHNALSSDGAAAIADCSLIPPEKTAAAWITDNGAERFHDYYTWAMGNAENPTGEIYYRPATDEQKGEYDLNGTMLREPQVVSDPLTEASPLGDAHLEYKAQVDELMAQNPGMNEAEALSKLELAKTLPSSIITMEDWIKGNLDAGGDRAPYQQGNYWIIDQTDGWCYWGSLLNGGSATGLLLDKVTRTSKKFDSNAEYCINAWLQAVDTNDLGQFEVSENGGISESGRKLAELLAGKLIIAADGSVYTDNGDGTFTLSENADGTPAEAAAPFIGLGVNESGGLLGYAAPTESRVEIGTRVTIDEMVWDGADYENWDTIAADAKNNWYNISPTEETGVTTTGGKQIYEVTGMTLGADGFYYLTLAPMAQGDTAAVPLTDEPIYVGSVIKADGGSAPADDGAFAYALTQGVVYRQAHPGAGPFAVIYAGSDNLPGNDDDSRYPLEIVIETRRFYHTGSGVYVEIENKGETASKDNPVKYYFAGRYLTSSVISSGDMSGKIANAFPLQLAEGDKFDMVFGAVVSRDVTAEVTSIKENALGAYTLDSISADETGALKMIITEDKSGFIECGDDAFLGNAGDRYITAAENISESFLLEQGILFSEQLAVGSVFKADGYDWVVIGIDRFGNRLILSKDRIPSMGARLGSTVKTPAYEKTLWPEKAKTFINTLTTLKRHALPAYLPEEPEYAEKAPWADIPPGDGLSVALAKDDGTTFPLSAGEYATYISKNAALQDKIAVGGLWGLRSRYFYWATTVDINGAPYSAHTNTDYPPCMAMWVRFSDADKLAAATEAELSAWKNMPELYSTYTLDGIDWYVIGLNGTNAELLAKTHTEAKRAHDTWPDTYPGWSALEIRTYLNETWLNGKATLKERAQTVTLLTDKNHSAADASLKWERTQDKVYLLSNAQAYALPDNIRKNNSTGYFLRSQCEATGYPQNIGFVDYDGTITSNNPTAIFGIRPVVTVSMIGLVGN